MTDLDLNKMLAKFIPNSIVDPFKMSRKLQQPTFMALAGRPSIDSQEGLWSSNQPLMANSEKETQDGNHNVSKRRYRQCSQMLWIHLLLIVLYTLVFLTATGLWNYQHARNIAYSPVSKAVKYQKMSYDGKLDGISPFRGEPRPELDKAWHDLLENNNIRLSKDELQKMNRTALELYDGSGFFGQLSAYHHLHCLKFLRQVLHSESYDVNTPDRDTHVDHCVDDIRQALMCHADTSVLTFDWRPNWRTPWPNFSVDHTCVDWDALDSWAAERSFSLFDQKSLVHPELGLAFPIVNGSIEDISHGPEMHIVWPEDRA